MARALGESFLDRVSPNRVRERSIPWPLDPAGAERVDVRLLSDADREVAYFATRDHFDALKVDGKKRRRVENTDPAFENRERVELVWRAFSHAGVPLAHSAAELAAQPGEVIDALYRAWLEFQGVAAARPVDEQAVGAIIDGLKKNIPAAALAGLPSTWLIAVITSLVGPSSSSTNTNDSG